MVISPHPLGYHRKNTGAENRFQEIRAPKGWTAVRQIIHPNSGFSDPSLGPPWVFLQNSQTLNITAIIKK